MQIEFKRRLHNPHKEKASRVESRRAKRSAPNPGELMTLGYINPQRGTAVKAKKKKHSKKARQPNPSQFAAKAKAHTPKRPRKRNPELSISRPVEVVKSGAVALAGLVATRQLPQLVLGARNTGVVGYASNAAAAAIAAAVAGKFAGKSAASLVLIGGGLYIVNRIMTEHFSPVGKYLSLTGVGDAAAAARLGRVKEAYFPYPVLHDKAGNPIIPREIDARRLALPAGAPASAVSGVSRIRGGRLAA